MAHLAHRATMTYPLAGPTLARRPRQRCARCAKVFARAVADEAWQIRAGSAADLPEPTSIRQNAP